MSRNARIEEVSDSDSDSNSDPSDMDPEEFTPQSSIIRPANIPTQTPKPGFNPASGLPTQLQPQFKAPSAPQIDEVRYRKWQCLYPVYFDSTRTRAEGRRVGKELAVPSPLAREIADAVSGCGLDVVLEVGKTHPKDWANPGRVRANLEGGGGRVKNKHHLYILVSKYLKQHPTTADTPFRAGMQIQGMPIPERPVPPPAKPRGWKISDVIPLHSPAMSGGGVSENMFKEMMQGMGGGQMPGMVEGPSGAGGGGGGGGEGKMKKPKRKVIRA